MSRMVTLGLNVDHVATLRQARRDVVPDVLSAAQEGVRGGAKGITVHLREDRRHIQDRDVLMLRRNMRVPINLEMSIAPEIVRFAARTKPQKACLVPEKRAELTTEGGLDIRRQMQRVASVVRQLQKAGTVVSLFIAPDYEQLKAAYRVGADFVELHTGTYANVRGRRRLAELERLHEASQVAHELGIGVNAGHGLNYENVTAIARLPHVEELNIGHSIIARSVFVGIRRAVGEMAALIRKAAA